VTFIRLEHVRFVTEAAATTWLPSVLSFSVCRTPRRPWRYSGRFSTLGTPLRSVCELHCTF
jgi:hypothetical protein